MPMPVSRNFRTIPSNADRATTDTEPPGGVNFIALSIRMRSSLRSDWLSPFTSSGSLTRSQWNISPLASAILAKAASTLRISSRRSTTSSSRVSVGPRTSANSGVLSGRQTLLCKKLPSGNSASAFLVRPYAALQVKLFSRSPLKVESATNSHIRLHSICLRLATYAAQNTYAASPEACQSLLAP